MKKTSILIVEHDKTMAKMLKNLFEGNEYTVFTTDNGLKALQLYHDKQPNVVLTDFDVPEKNGCEVLAEIRATDRMTPVVIMSGLRIGEEDSIECYNAGCNLFLRKPFFFNELKAAINNMTVRNNEYSFEIRSFGNSILNPATLTLTINNKDYKLAEREAKVLFLLVENSDRLISFGELLNEIWKNINANNRQMLMNIISELKKKLKKDPNVSIESHYGKGYIFKY